VKFNKKTKGQSKMVNYEGATSYKVDPKSELVTRVLCTLVGESKFYVSGEQSDEELVDLLRKVAEKNFEFCLQLAAYARCEMHLRSVPQLILVEMANHPKRFSEPGLIRKYAPYIIQRADEITECLTYHLDKFKKPIPNSLKKALADAFNRFDAYQLSKYNRNAKVRLRDALFLSHAKPKDEAQAEIFKKLADKILEPPETWEVVISTKGSKKETWESIIPKMGYFATLRNLKNFLEKDVDLKPVIARLTNPEKVASSKLLPFRFLSAYREIEKTGISFRGGSIMIAIAEAADLSLANIPHLGGYTCVAVDNSGSMDSPLSKRGTVRYNDVAALMGASLNKISNALVIVFSENAQLMTLNRNNDVLSNTQRILLSCQPSSTNAWKVPKLLMDKGIKIDRLILLSDQQCWDSTIDSWSMHPSHTFADYFREYRQKLSPNCILYSVDLAGYGKGIQVPQGEKNTVLMAGWSERIFDFIAHWEEERGTQVKTIKNYLKSDRILENRKKLTLLDHSPFKMGPSQSPG